MRRRQYAQVQASELLAEVEAALRDCHEQIESLERRAGRGDPDLLTELRELADGLADRLRILEAAAKDRADVRAALPGTDPSVAVGAAMIRRESPVLPDGPRLGADPAALPSTARLVKYRRLRWGLPLPQSDREAIPPPGGTRQLPRYSVVLLGVILATLVLVLVVLALFDRAP